MLKADLAATAVHVEDIFLKPAGQPATASLDGTWEIGEIHKLDGTLSVAIPLAQVLVKGPPRPGSRRCAGQGPIVPTRRRRWKRRPSAGSAKSRWRASGG